MNKNNCNGQGRPGGARWITLALIVVSLAGCAGPWRDDDFMTFVVPMDSLRDIQPQNLDSQSVTPPQRLEDITPPERFELPEPADRIELSIEEARAAALAYNLDLKVQLVEPSIAATAIGVEEARFENTFNISARRQKFDSPTAVSTQSSGQTTDSFSAGLEIPLRTGGTVNINFPFSETETASSFMFSTLNPAVNTDLSFSISQPVLRNAGQYIQTHAIRVARYQFQIADARTKLEAIRILANVDRAYWRLYAARRQLDVRVQQYELALSQLDQARRRVAAGDSPQIEITRAQSGTAARLEGIIISNTQVMRAQRNLKRIIHRDDLPLDSETAVFMVTEPAPLGLDLDPARLARHGVENRMEMLELELQLAVDASTIDFQRNQALPLVTLDYTYNINGLGGTHSSAFDQLDDRSFEDWTFGVNVQVPVGNEAAKGRLHGAILRRLQRLATKELRAQAIEQEVYDAVDQLRQDWQRIIAARQETQLSLRTYEGEQRQFEVGVRTSTDVLDAAASLADAQTREIQALTDYQISQIDIAFATGTLLGHDRIQWDPTDIPRTTDRDIWKKGFRDAYRPIAAEPPATGPVDR